MTQTLLDKTLIVVVGYNNHALLQQFVSSLEKHDSGYPYDLFIADNSSSDEKHLKLLENLSRKYNVQTFENDRVESTFAKVTKLYLSREQYKYYFFVHDDTCINENGWLKKYVDRLLSGHVEDAIKGTKFENIPVGRVGSNHQPWRNYDSILGYPIDSRFLYNYLLRYYPQPPEMYKFVDPERVLYTHKCLRSDLSGIRSLANFKYIEKHSPEEFEKVCEILNSSLHYTDEGIPPRDVYPAGKAWNKMTMLSEFLNSVIPLMHGYRSIGLEGDGFLEQIHGPDEPWGHKTIIHWGSPNIKRFLGKYFKVSSEEIHKKIYSKDITFLIKCQKIVSEYYKLK